ncbi:MAG: hypothetical protein H0X62_04175 [Bacteroidetes bacterium]|nr:hypothetical protein [Bacteroidota bacterium]
MNDFLRREVHTYVFQTSRYADFSGQVNSYILEEDNGIITKRAVFKIELIPSVNLTVAQNVVGDSISASDPLRINYADPLDRLLYGVFKLQPLSPAITTEFNLIVSSTGQKLGVLLRNPEPFNNPKIPVASIPNAITMALGGTQFKAIYSKDRSSVFITPQNNSLNFSGGIASFVFKYYRFDGTNSGTGALLINGAYYTPETINVNNIDLNI